MAPWRMRLVLNDAASINFVDATLASAFVARRGAGYKVETPVAVFGGYGTMSRRPALGGEDASDVRDSAQLGSQLGVLRLHSGHGRR